VNPPAPAPDLAALARKYGALAALRARRDGGAASGPPATRDELRALAAEFPGCLRELDTLGQAELERRAAACDVAARGSGGMEPWMLWIDAYHALMRAALRLRRGEQPAAPDVDPELADAVRAPPEGRVSVVVLRALAVRFGVPPTTIAAALFPVRRPSPYRL
jgi:hypothetical protein